MIATYNVEIPNKTSAQVKEIPIISDSLNPESDAEKFVNDAEAESERS